MKQIGIEGSLFFKPGSGIGQYAKNLTKAVSKIESDVHFDIIRHYLPLKPFTPPIQPTPQLGYRLVRWFPPVVYYQLFKRARAIIPYNTLALKKYDAILFFNFIGFPVSKKTKSVIFVHDVAYKYYPEHMQSKNLAFLEKFLPKSIEESDHIITISEHTKKDIIKFFGTKESKISVVTPAIDGSVFYPQDKAKIKSVKEKYNLPAKYIHYHGTLEPRKNLSGLLDAYSKLPNNIKAEYGVVLSGGKGWNDNEIYSSIEKLRSEGSNIVTTGYIDTNQEVAAIYSGASLFAFPSHYEGFGIPPLEAMACGVPVICSNVSSLPEVVGSAAITVSPSNINDLSFNIQEVLTSKSLSSDLSKKGIARAKLFSWDKSARDLIKILDRL